MPLELWTLLPAVQVRPDVGDDDTVIVSSYSQLSFLTIFDKHVLALAARQTENHQLRALALLFSWRTGKSLDYCVQLKVRENI